ncbi:hypothetical protein L3Y34_005197 [Caenorhabditis briggsae]|uniref:Uncharacterized protein n=1 Tax=Caenorhabditis briggsae TaxID=6238 RepID=A0AAE9D5Y1_CAEBR|nr:hypothetical protein L3Y34_005197 [Caenorhabditis briggsae]
MPRGRRCPKPPSLYIKTFEIPILTLYVIYIIQFPTHLSNGWPILIAWKLILIAWQNSLRRRIAEGRYRHTSSAIFHLLLLFKLKIITSVYDLFWNSKLSDIDPAVHTYGWLYVAQSLVINTRQFYAMYLYVQELAEVRKNDRHRR